MQAFRKTCLGISGIAVLAIIIGLAARSAAWWQPAAVISTVCLALGLGASRVLRTYQFTVWIVAAVIAALIYPAYFLHVGPIDLPMLHLDQINLRDKRIILAIMQIVMFGMGTQMSLRDFAGLGHMSYGVVIGVMLQFTIMPLVGYGLAVAFDFPPEIAAGIVLIGSCSSGLASNVMTYMARRTWHCRSH
jgi:BASS family bile acid:Na+ symporter